jgi:hypothetical protein
VRRAALVDGLSPHSAARTLSQVGPLRPHSTGTRLTRQGRDNPPGPAHPNKSSFPSCHIRRTPVLGPQAFSHPVEVAEDCWHLVLASIGTAGAEAGRDNAHCMPHCLSETEISWSRLVKTRHYVFRKIMCGSAGVNKEYGWYS